MEKDPQLLRIRSKKLGLLLYDARQYASRSIEQCSSAIGVNPEKYRDFEAGIDAPSLPEIETAAYYFRLPVSHFWGDKSISEEKLAKNDLDIAHLKHIRDRIIGTMIRSERDSAQLSLNDLSSRVRIEADILNQYEEGVISIPLPELEMIINVFQKSIHDFLDQKSPVGLWHNQIKLLDLLQNLPEESQQFLCQPVNLPYIELAMRLNTFPAEKLRTIAESLLEITY